MVEFDKKSKVPAAVPENVPGSSPPTTDGFNFGNSFRDYQNPLDSSFTPSGSGLTASDPKVTSPDAGLAAALQNPAAIKVISQYFSPSQAKQIGEMMAKWEQGMLERLPEGFTEEMRELWE
jgi:hypothetical protein